MNVTTHLKPAIINQSFKAGSAANAGVKIGRCIAGVFAACRVLSLIMYLGIAILIIYLPLALTFFMVGETFVGLAAVALAIAGAGIALLIELRKGRGDVNGMLNFLRNSTLSTVDEKIAVLYGYANNVPTWKDKKLNIDLMTRQILSDISSIARVRNNIDYPQWREVLKVLASLIESMQKENYDTREIKLSLEALK